MSKIPESDDNNYYIELKLRGEIPAVNTRMTKDKLNPKEFEDFMNLLRTKIDSELKWHGKVGIGILLWLVLMIFLIFEGNWFLWLLWFAGLGAFGYKLISLHKTERLKIQGFLEEQNQYFYHPRGAHWEVDNGLKYLHLNLDYRQSVGDYRPPIEA